MKELTEALDALHCPKARALIQEAMCYEDYRDALTGPGQVLEAGYWHYRAQRCWYEAEIAMHPVGDR